MSRKLKIVRVVTSANVIPWHLENTLKRISDDFDVCVVGDGVSVYKNQYPKIKWVDIHIPRKTSLKYDAVALFLLIRFLLSYKPDIIHSVMHKAAFISALAGLFCRVPVRINTFTSQYWATKKGISKGIYYSTDWLVNKLNTYCLSDSSSQSIFLQKNGISMKGAPLPVLLKGSLSGVDLKRLNLETIRIAAKDLKKELGISCDSFVFLFLARKSIDKGIVELLNAFSLVHVRCPNTYLLFVGPDESDGKMNYLQNSNPALFKNVININRSVSDREMYIEVSDILCLPSHREGFGSIVIDAAAQGVPTIGTDIPGLVDAIENHVTGVLVPLGDVEKLADVMCDAFNNKEKYKKMGFFAKDRVHKYFTADLMYEALKNLYIDMAMRARI
jgi:glycosyltransferase involved in cell wall biosynthesis